jgi:hypothetical protein
VTVPSYFTKSEARTAAKQVVQKSAGKTYGKLLNESRAAAKDTDVFDVFLSHSILDAELIAGAKDLLEQQGFTVYVDWIDDPQLNRSAVSKETAATLRRRMRQSRSLIYVATDSAAASKWMPWELGYFDGFRPGQVAVMPLLDNDGDSFPKQEYLELYPIVRKDTYKNGTKDLFVEAVGSQWTTLAKFGKGSADWRPYG